jgi:hypothetical protein
MDPNNPTTPQPTDGAIAQAFREYRTAENFRNKVASFEAIERRAAEIDATRPAQLGGGVVSDEMVERACKAAYVVPTDFARKDMRAALEAALGKGGA